jgi:hypothetical protein
MTVRAFSAIAASHSCNSFHSIVIQGSFRVGPKFGPASRQLVGGFAERCFCALPIGGADGFQAGRRLFGLGPCLLQIFGSGLARRVGPGLGACCEFIQLDAPFLQFGARPLRISSVFRCRWIGFGEAILREMAWRGRAGRRLGGQGPEQDERSDDEAREQAFHCGFLSLCAAIANFGHKASGARRTLAKTSE